MTVTKFNSVPTEKFRACYEYYDYTYTAYRCKDDFLSYIVKLD